MIFLDASYIISLIIKNDPFYHISEKIEHYLNKEAKITNITVLVEVLNSVNSYNFHGNINDLRDHIRRNLIVQAHDCAIFINMLNSQHAINNNIGNNLNNGNKENTTPNIRRS